MSNLILDEARDILKRSFIHNPSQYHEVEGQLNGTPNTPWSFYILAAGTITSVIVTIAGVILNTTNLIIGGIYYTATNGLGAFSIKSYENLQLLETYIKILAKRVSEITADVVALSTDNKNLKESANQLKKELNQAQKAFDVDKVNFQKEIKTLNQSEDFLKKRIDELQKFEGLVLKYQNEAALLQSEVGKYSQENALLEKNVSNLSAQLTQLTQERNSLNATVNNLKGNIESYKDGNTQLDTLIKTFQTTFNLLDKKQIDPTLDKTPDKIGNDLQQIEQNADRLNQALDNAQKVLDTVKHHQ